MAMAVGLLLVAVLLLFSMNEFGGTSAVGGAGGGRRCRLGPIVDSQPIVGRGADQALRRGPRLELRESTECGPTGQMRASTAGGDLGQRFHHPRDAVEGICFDQWGEDVASR